MGTLEDRDQAYWATLKAGVNRDDRLAALGRLPIEQLSTEDLRQLIDHGASLGAHVPLALERLQANPKAQGALYPGDLLEALKTVPDAFWDQNTELRRAWFKILSQALGDENTD